MSHERNFAELLTELERIGIDPSSFPAVVHVRQEDALRVLRTLPSDIGPAAFLTALREEQKRASGPVAVIRKDGAD
ncbi:MAG: hypothetical protein JWM95_3308 [Gemmatimonadetes bacterium]|nr:hypothetical protein [Gemmatimonadota bacterium]